ncbi:MAG: transporter substrate-binding domain-containing protein [Erysipelotrichaceae bacterium]|nr:transporter substrate-binding domain-containing protein [Erysipelotrichaceae bacterium]
MKKKLIGAAVLLIAFFGIFAYMKMENVPAGSRIQTEGTEKPVTKIVVGYDQSKFGKGQTITNGADYSIFMRSAMEELGWEPEFVPMKMSEVEEAINTGTIDCYWNTYTYQGREDKYVWTDPYMSATPVLIYKTDHQDFGEVGKSFSAASTNIFPSGKKIGLKAESMTYHDLPDSEKQIVSGIGSFVYYPDYRSLKAALDSGEIDMILMEAGGATPLFDGDAYSSVSFAPGKTNSYAVAFKKDDPEAVKKAQDLTTVLRTLFNNGTIKKNAYAYWTNTGLSIPDQNAFWGILNQSWLLK